MKRKRRRKGLLVPPGPGRNLAVRPGGGPHRPDEEKRARDRLRRELEDQEDESGDAGRDRSLRLV